MVLTLAYVCLSLKNGDNTEACINTHTEERKNTLAHMHTFTGEQQTVFGSVGGRAETREVDQSVL